VQGARLARRPADRGRVHAGRGRHGQGRLRAMGQPAGITEAEHKANKEGNEVPRGGILVLAR